MIVSTVAGRIRVRSNRLKSARFAESVEKRLRGLEGIADVRTNPAAGSLIVSYDTQRIDTVELEDRLEHWCVPPSNGARNGGRGVSRHLNRATKIGMMATLGTSIAAGFLGNKKAHIGFGTAFVAFAGMHMFRYQGTLVR